MEWSRENTKIETPCALLKENDKLICKAYLSPDLKFLRLVLPEMINIEQVDIDLEHKLIDFKRKP